MVDRKYSVQEIEKLRRAVDNQYLYGRYRGPSLGRCWSWPYNEAEKAKIVEERVRTHLLAGHTAEDLLASEA